MSENLALIPTIEHVVRQMKREGRIRQIVGEYFQAIQGKKRNESLDSIPFAD